MKDSPSKDSFSFYFTACFYDIKAIPSFQLIHGEPLGYNLEEDFPLIDLTEENIRTFLKEKGKLVGKEWGFSFDWLGLFFSFCYKVEY